MPPRRWTDDRLDDLAKIVYHNDGRLDDAMNMAAQSTNDLTAMKAAQKDRSFSRVQQLLIAAALLSPVATIVAALLEHH